MRSFANLSSSDSCRGFDSCTVLVYFRIWQSFCKSLTHFLRALCKWLAHPVSCMLPSLAWKWGKSVIVIKMCQTYINKSGHKSFACKRLVDSRPQTGLHPYIHRGLKPYLKMDTWTKYCIDILLERLVDLYTQDWGTYSCSSVIGQ